MKARSGLPGMISNRSMPPGTVTPVLAYRDVGEAVAWLCEAFGFKERLRIGNHRSQLVVGDASVVVAARPAELQHLRGEATHSIMVRVADVDRHYTHVKQSGARIISPPVDYPFGERQYTVEDLGGHRWTFTQSIADVDPAEWDGILTDGAADAA